MAAPRILFVKLSSLGDVIHNFPAVSDVRARHPEAYVAWAVEEAYAPLVRMHAGVDEAIPVALRAVRSRPWSPGAWKRLRAARRRIARGPWDYVIDTQGLLKSAWIARGSRAFTFGPDRASARERSAARHYDVPIPVPRGMHAVERNRRLAAEVLGYPHAGPPRYELTVPAQPPDWAPQGRYAVLLHAASRAAKRWPDRSWIELGGRLAAAGFAAVLPGGTPAERDAAERLASRIPGALAAPAMDLPTAAAVLAHAWVVVGVDTGLTHLAVALGRPTVGLYGATDPALTGLHGGGAANLGRKGAPPAVDEVAASLGLEPPAPAA